MSPFEKSWLILKYGYYGGHTDNPFLKTGENCPQCGRPLYKQKYSDSELSVCAAGCGAFPPQASQEAKTVNPFKAAET